MLTPEYRADITDSIDSLHAIDQLEAALRDQKISVRHLKRAGKAVASAATVSASPWSHGTALLEALRAFCTG
jgi:hypothetical protein